MAAQDRIFAWVVLQEEGTDVPSPASRVWKSSQHPDRPFDIDALQECVKAKFALRLQHVDAADLKVYAGDKELTTLSALVVDQTVGACEENPLRITYPPLADATGMPPELAATEDVFKDLSSLLAFFESCRVKVTDQSERRSKPLAMVNDKRFEFHGRIDVLKRILLSWLNRWNLLAGGKRGDKCEVLVLPSAPGLGKSRTIDALAGRVDGDDEFGDARAKAVAIEDILSSGANNAKDFCEKIKTASSVCVTFNSSCSRGLDRNRLPPSSALCARLLWSYFCQNEDYQIFLKKTDSCLNTATFPRVVHLILEDAGTDDHVIICVDELKMVDTEPDVTSVSPVSQGVEEVLSAMAKVLDTEPRAHIAMTSISTTSVSKWTSKSNRTPVIVPVERLTEEAAQDAWNSRNKGTGGGATSPARGEDQAGQSSQEIIKQIVRDCAGVPRWLELVDTELNNWAVVGSLGGVQERLWQTKMKSSWWNNIPEHLSSVLELALSGKTYPLAQVQIYCEMGMLVQAQLDDVEPEIPPIVLGMLYIHETKQSVAARRLEYNMLHACYRFMVLDKVCTTASRSSNEWQHQAAHLLRIRLFLLKKRGSTHFTLNDLLVVENGPRMEAHEVWQRDTTKHRQYRLPEESSFEVLELDEADILQRLSEKSRVAGIYLFKRDNFEGLDGVLVLPDDVLGVQMKLSAKDATTKISNETINRTILNSRIHEQLCRHISAVIILGLRRSTNNCTAQALNEQFLWTECKEVCVLARERVLNLVPKSLRLRPNLQVVLHLSAAEDAPDKDPPTGAQAITGPRSPLAHNDAEAIQLREENSALHTKICEYERFQELAEALENNDRERAKSLRKSLMIEANNTADLRANWHGLGLALSETKTAQFSFQVGNEVVLREELIEKVNDIPIANLKHGEVAQLIRGPLNTQVRLKLRVSSQDCQHTMNTRSSQREVTLVRGSSKQGASSRENVGDTMDTLAAAAAGIQIGIRGLASK